MIMYEIYTFDADKYTVKWYHIHNYEKPRNTTLCIVNNPWTIYFLFGCSQFSFMNQGNVLSEYSEKIIHHYLIIGVGYKNNMPL
jgi:hypothetical protein